MAGGKEGSAGLGIFDYMGEAFKVPYNLILFAGGLLAGVVTLLPTVVWPLVAAGEILYLVTLGHNRRFQAVVRARRRGGEAVRVNDVAERVLASLSPDRRERFERVRKRCVDLQASFTRAGGTADRVGDLLASQQSSGVNRLLWVFARTLAQEQVLANFVASMPRREIEETLARTRKGLAAPEALSDSMKTAYQENVTVLEKRLENLARAEEHLKNLQAHLVRVENSIMLIQEQALTRQDPGFIETEVSSVTAGLSSVEDVLKSMNLPAVDTATAEAGTPELLAPARVAEEA